MKFTFHGGSALFGAMIVLVWVGKLDAIWLPLGIAALFDFNGVLAPIWRWIKGDNR